jgi:hypothetical protein
MQKFSGAEVTKRRNGMKMTKKDIDENGAASDPISPR